MKRLIDSIIYHKMKFIILGVLYLLGKIFPSFGKFLTNVLAFIILLVIIGFILILKSDVPINNSTPTNNDDDDPNFGIYGLPDKTEHEKAMDEVFFFHHYQKKDWGMGSEDDD